MRSCGVPCAPYAALTDESQLASVPDDLFPGILKTARLGYDGKGQVRVAERAALQAAWAQLKGVPCVLEKQLPLAAECSAIVARGRSQAGEKRCGVTKSVEHGMSGTPEARSSPQREQARDPWQPTALGQRSKHGRQVWPI